MTKGLRKQIMKRPKSENLYFKWPSRGNFLTYKNEKNKQMSQHDRICLKSVFSKSHSKKSSKSFWSAIKPFATNRAIITNDSINLEEIGVLKNDPKEATEVLSTTI